MIRKLLGFFSVTSHLPDHDIRNLKASRTSSTWSHCYTCTECNAPVGHSEFMTKICLSCGQSMKYHPRSAASRSIILNGSWVKTVKVGGVERVLADRAWTPIETLPTP